MIPIYEAGEHDGQLYLAMRFVEGSDLRTLLDREGKLDPERTLAILGQVAGALDAAHRRALVHRDVKPANVLLAGDGHVYLTDFGITKQLGRAPTDTGRFVGTLDYLAPEQIRGDPSTAARTATPLVVCSTSAWPAGRPFTGRPRRRPSGRTCRSSPGPIRGHEAARPGAPGRRWRRTGRTATGAHAELIEAAAGALGVAAPHTAARAARRRARRPGVLLVAGGLLLLVAAGGAAIAALGGGRG